MDEKLILFEDNRIFSLTGQGPTPTGDQNDFSEPSLVTSDAGCIDPRSIVLIPIGILFQSNKGIYLLSRSLETKYIGAPVEAFNNQTITSAKLLQDQNQVRLLSSDGTTLVYDYFSINGARFPITRERCNGLGKEWELCLSQDRWSGVAAKHQLH